MCELTSIYCPISGPLYRYIPSDVLFFASAPFCSMPCRVIVDHAKGIQRACAQQAQIGPRAIDTESTMKTKKISSLEAWERQKALLAKRKPRAGKRNRSNQMTLEFDLGSVPIQLGKGSPKTNACKRNTNACKRRRQKPRRLAGGCLLYRFPAQLRSA